MYLNFYKMVRKSTTNVTLSTQCRWGLGEKRDMPSENYKFSNTRKAMLFYFSFYLSFYENWSHIAKL